MSQKALRHWWRCLCGCCQRSPGARSFQAARPALPAPAAAPPPVARRYILIVEDDASMAEAIQAALRLEG